jgi:hypothetical protein
MKILNYLKKRDDRSYQAFIPSKSGKFSLSIVAGEGLYSTPRKKADTIEEYTHVELAIFNADTENWASYNEVEKIFPIIGNGEYYINETDEDEDLNRPRSCVFGWVEVDKLNQVWETL